MKVLHIITGLGQGGAESVLYRVCTMSKDVEHHVISLTTEGIYGPLLSVGGIRVTALNMTAGHLSIRGLFRLYRLLLDERPDTVQTWMYHADLIGGVLARMAGIRNVFWNIRHSDLKASGAKRSTVLVSKICALLSAFVPKYIVCCAQKAKDEHVKYGYSKNKIVVINNGFIFDEFQPDVLQRNRVRKQLSLDSSAVVVGMVSRFHPLKNHQALLQSLAVLKRNGVSFKCLLVGTGMDYSNRELMKWLNEGDLMDDVLLLGSRRDISAIMNALDIHLLSSVAEGFPNVLAEAMACGTPCVSTDVGDANVIVGANGWLVEAKAPLEFATNVCEAIEECCSKPDEWNNRRKDAVEHIRREFSVEKMVESYQALWLS